MLTELTAKETELVKQMIAESMPRLERAIIARLNKLRARKQKAIDPTGRRKEERDAFTAKLWDHFKSDEFHVRDVIVFDPALVARFTGLEKINAQRTALGMKFQQFEEKGEVFGPKRIVYSSRMGKNKTRKWQLSILA